jgi:hypothetical protein
MAEFESTRERKPPSSETSVVYDPRNGRIVYAHEFIGDGTGIYGPDGREERARVALEGVRRHHKGAAQLRVMHLPSNFRFEPDTLYRVDRRTGKIAVRPVVPAAAPTRRRRNTKKRAR